MSISINVLAIGASRNIGYYTAERLLGVGAHVTYLLRNPSVFDNDAMVQSYVQSGKAHLIKGDCLVQDDAERGWVEAQKYGNVDLLLFTVGTLPTFSLTKGIVMIPDNPVTQCLLNALCTMPSPHPKIVTISSIGITHASHKALPLLLKPVYGLLTSPHKDKIGSEMIMAHCAGLPWNPADDTDEHILGAGWKQRSGLPAAGSLNNVMVIRPALLTDGECRADNKSKKRPYRISDKELTGYTVSRKDVAHFIADTVLNHWEEYRTKPFISIAY